MAKKNGKPSPFGFNNLMAVAAFRYCLGRRTYIVGVCADWIIEQWPNFTDNVKSLIKRELEEEFKRDDEDRLLKSNHNALGHDCDREEWERVRKLWDVDND